AMPAATVSCRVRMYWKPSVASTTSRKPCSTVPGLPNMWVMPSARSCSNSATLPGLLTAVLPVACGWRVGAAWRAYRPLAARPGQAGLEDLDDLLAGGERVGRGPAGDERVVHDHRDRVPEVAVVAAVRTGGVAQDVLQRVRRRAHVEVDAEEAGA